jgi:hypothetical protein
VSEITEFLNEGDIDITEISSPIVWLCPNCHKYVHVAMDCEPGEIRNVLGTRAYDQWFCRQIMSILSMRYEARSKIYDAVIARNDAEIERCDAKLRAYCNVSETGYDHES